MQRAGSHVTIPGPDACGTVLNGGTDERLHNREVLRIVVTELTPVFPERHIRGADTLIVSDRSSVTRISSGRTVFLTA
jgi:hypothetical protein